nr:RNA-directed DNA polymerase, eukaryota [Tanacetum cinerariifolium]
MHLHANVVRFEHTPFQQSQPPPPTRPGEVIDLEECKNDLLARKRICIKTKQEDNILEKFKIIVQGKFFVIRAKELFVWSPVFNEVTEGGFCSDDESIMENEINMGSKEVNNKQANLDVDSDVDGVSETYFGDQEENRDLDQAQSVNMKENSSDPFNIYDLLEKRNKEKEQQGMDTSTSHPPGFTPEKVRIDANVIVTDSVGLKSPLSHSNGFNSRVMEDTSDVDVQPTSFGRTNTQELKKGGSILEVLDNMIKASDTRLRKRGSGSYVSDISDAIGNSGGILCMWDPNVFHKDQHILSDNFVALYGTWIPNKTKHLVVFVYAPQPITDKRMLWSFIEGLISQWNGESIVMDDFNEVRFERDRLGSVFNAQGANEFNNFITNSGLVEIQLEGFSFTWSHPSASKMSKLDRFLVTEGVLSLFPHTSAICLDKNLLDHHPVLLWEVFTDYGATPFRLYHSWFNLDGFEQMVTTSWHSIVLDDSNGMVRFKKKLQFMKKKIRSWVADYKQNQSGHLRDIKVKLHDIDIILDQGGMLMIFFCIMVDGDWVDDPYRVKEEFRLHFATRFQDPGVSQSKLNFTFPNRLTLEKITYLEKPVSNDEIRKAVWDCGENKSPGPDGFSFEFFHKFWSTIGPDMCAAVDWFFTHGIKNSKLWYSKLILLKLMILFGWDYLDDVLNAFGFGTKWRSWIKGSLTSGMASILVNGSPTFEFRFHCGLKQGDPLAPYLFILVMESLHLSVSRAVEAGIFSGGNMSKIKAWDKIIGKLKSRLSKWKLKTLSIGGRLTLLKSVLGATPIYSISLYKVPKFVLNSMESIRRNFFNGIQDGDRKISWVKWSKVLSSKKYGCLGVSSFFALNMAFLFKWIWRFISHDNSLWFRFILAMHGTCIQNQSPFHFSTWNAIVREVNVLKNKGVDLISYCKIHVGSGMNTKLWSDIWVGDSPLFSLFPRLYALETVKDSTVANKLQGPISQSFRQPIRGGAKDHQLEGIQDLVGSKTFLPKENVATRWVKTIPIKINVFAWKLYPDRIPTRFNLLRRGVQVPVGSYSDWLVWFKSIRLGANSKVTDGNPSSVIIKQHCGSNTISEVVCFEVSGKEILASMGGGCNDNGCMVMSSCCGGGGIVAVEEGVGRWWFSIPLAVVVGGHSKVVVGGHSKVVHVVVGGKLRWQVVVEVGDCGVAFDMFGEAIKQWTVVVEKSSSGEMILLVINW